MRLRIDNGFTLIELLVVMAVVSVLMAVMLPVLHNVRSMAKRTMCQSQLRQITLAWFQYLDDHEGRFCRGMNRNYNFGGWQGIGNSKNVHLKHPLNGYVGLETAGSREDAKLFQCPSDQGGEDYDQTAFTYFGNSYEANHLMVGPVPPLPNWPSEPWSILFQAMNEASLSLTRDTITQASELAFLGDHNWRNQWDPLNTYECARSWHGKRHQYNLAFFDGHTKVASIKKGLSVTAAYRVNPCVKQSKLILEHQVSVPCVCETEPEN